MVKELYQMPNFKSWEDDPNGLRIAGESATFLVAPEVLRKPDGSTLFDYNEVKQIANDLPDGWQIPDDVIMTMLVDTVGKKRDLRDGETLIESLQLPLDGYAYSGTCCKIVMDKGKLATVWLANSDKVSDIPYHRILKASPSVIESSATERNPLGFPSCEDTCGCMILLVRVITKRY